MNIPTKHAVIAAVVLVAGLAVSGWLASHSSGQAAFWRGVAESEKKTGEEWRQRAVDAMKWGESYRKVADTEREAKDRAMKDLALAKAQIPAPRPAPSTPELAVELGKAGMRIGFKVFDDDQPSKVNRHDAEMMWAWNQSAAMVPALQSSLRVAEKALDLGNLESEHLRKAYDGAFKSAEYHEKATEAEKARSEAMGKVIKNLDREMKSRQLQKWLQITGAVVAGYVAGRAIK